MTDSELQYLLSREVDAGMISRRVRGDLAIADHSPDIKPLIFALADDKSDGELLRMAQSMVGKQLRKE